MIDLVIANLRVRPFRTLISIVGVGLGVVLVVLFTGLAQGMTNDMARRAANWKAEIVFTRSGAMSLDSSNMSVSTAYVKRLLEIEGVKSVVPVGRYVTPDTRGRWGIQQLDGVEPFDAIVSGLPFNNFPVDLVASILKHLETLAAPGATLSFFEYVAVRRIKGVVCKKPERDRLHGIGQVLNDAFARRQFRQECIVANVPPAWVHHLRFDS